MIRLTLAAALLAGTAHAQLSRVKTVFVVMMENHNWTGNNAGAKFGAPDIKGNALAPFINGPLVAGSAHAEQYFNPPGNHPSQPNYLWLEAGTNFGALADTRPSAPKIPTHLHLVHLLEQAGITWHAYAEPDFGSPSFDICPLGFKYLDVEHLPVDYFEDTTDGYKINSPECRAHVVPYSQLSTDLATNQTAQYNLIIPNLCHDGHEQVHPCSRDEPADNTARSDAWLSQNLPMIQASQAYRQGGAIFVIWDEAEDSKQFSDGPIGLFVLSPFAKPGYQNAIHYDHSSTLKTLQEIFNVGPLLGGAADPAVNDLSDLFQ